MRLIRRLIGAAVTATLLGALPTPSAEAAPRPVLRTGSWQMSTSDAVQAQQVQADVNSWRKAAGVKPLILSTDSKATAITQRLVDQQRYESLRHSDTYAEDFTAIGCRATGEVLAGFSGDQSEDLSGLDGHQPARHWWDSQAHREILMSPDATILTFAVSTRQQAPWGTPLKVAFWGANTLGECGIKTAPQAPISRPMPTVGPPGLSPAPVVAPQPVTPALRIERRGRSVRR